MPYGVFKMGPPSKPFCVFKKDEEGLPVGNSLGCHPTPEKARAQITAINMNEHIRTGARAGR